MPLKMRTGRAVYAACGCPPDHGTRGSTTAEGAFSGAGGKPSSMRLSGVCAVWLALVLVAAAGCDDSKPAKRERPPSPADVVPRDAMAYAEATIRLRGPTAHALRRFVSSLTGESTVSEDAVLDLLAEVGDATIDFELLERWLGTRGALFVADIPGDRARAGIV